MRLPSTCSRTYLQEYDCLLAGGSACLSQLRDTPAFLPPFGVCEPFPRGLSANTKRRADLVPSHAETPGQFDLKGEQLLCGCRQLAHAENPVAEVAVVVDLLTASFHRTRGGTVLRRKSVHAFPRLESP